MQRMKQTVNSMQRMKQAVNSMHATYETGREQCSCKSQVNSRQKGRVGTWPERQAKTSIGTGSERQEERVIQEETNEGPIELGQVHGADLTDLFCYCAVPIRRRTRTHVGLLNIYVEICTINGMLVVVVVVDYLGPHVLARLDPKHDAVDSKQDEVDSK